MLEFITYLFLAYLFSFSQMNRINDQFFTPRLEDFLDLQCYDGECIDQIISLINSATKQRLGKLDSHTLLEFVDNKQISTISILTAVVYIKKLMNIKSSKSILNEITSIDLFVVSVMVASKYIYDDVDECNAAYWAKAFDMELAELNRLEIKFLYALDWRFFTTYQEISELGVKIGIIKCGNSLAKLKSFYSNSLRPTLSHCLEFRRTKSAAKMLLLLSVYVAWISSSTDHRIAQDSLPNVNESHAALKRFNDKIDLINRMIGFEQECSMMVYSGSFRSKSKAYSSKCIDTYNYNNNNTNSIFQLVPCVV